MSEKEEVKAKTYFEDESGEVEQVKNAKGRFLELWFDKKYALATEVLVETMLHHHKIYTVRSDDRPEMYIYKEGIYIPEGRTEIEESLRNVLGEQYSQQIVNQVLTKIRADTYIDAELFFKDSDVFKIPVMNGILDLKEIKLDSFSSDQIYFSKLPVHYIPEMMGEKIEDFLKDILANEDDLTVFYELAGFGLIKDYTYEKAFMFVGNGRNGKTKAIELLKRLVGIQNCSNVSLSSIKHDSPFVSSMFGKLFNLAGDVSSNDLKETGMFKQLTGRDPISANRKYKNVLSFTNYAKFVFACNELPRVYDHSDGFWERWVLLEFPYYFAEKNIFDATPEDKRTNWKIKNPNIIEEITLATEMSGFLNKAIAGLHRLLINKKFSYSKGTAEVKDKWVRKADSFQAFCMDMIEEDFQSSISKKMIRSEYNKYCKLHNVRGTGDKSIKATLQDMYGAMEESKILTGVGSQEYCWTGIKFKEQKS